MHVRVARATPTRRWITSFRQISSFSSWTFSSGLVSLPHPEKKRGEDAAFVTPTAVGVADGVGGWARKGIDSGAYSRTLMAACELSTLTDPVKRLTEAYNTTKVPGSSTACIIQLSDDGTIHTANLGDSGFMLCRENAEEEGWSIIYASPSQCHYFNCPFQLGHGSRDTPAHADLSTLSVEPNDVVLVATDGLFDNLTEEEILSLLAGITEESKAQKHEAEARMQFTASTIVAVAHEIAKSETRLTPFAQAARQAGYKGTAGGKMDDITVVAALIQNK
ncbi:unnamed protein product [Aphanomyces euteiches]